MPAPAPAAPSPAAAPIEAAPSGRAYGGKRSAADLKGEWNRVLALMRERDKPTEAMLRSSTVLGLDGRVLRLATNEFVYKQISGNAATREMIESLLAEVLGQPCAVSCELSSSPGRRRESRPGNIPQDGLVATALDLGGEIVEAD